MNFSTKLLNFLRLFRDIVQANFATSVYKIIQNSKIKMQNKSNFLTKIYIKIAEGNYQNFKF